MLIRTDKSPQVRPDEELEFVLTCIDDSRKKKAVYDEIDAEVLENYLVQPMWDQTPTGPYHYRDNDPNRTILKDSETHQMIETLTAKVLLSTIGEPGFVQAQPVGYENVNKAEVASALLEGMFASPGNFRSMYVGFKDAFIFGAQAFFPSWDYFEGERIFRRVMVDPSNMAEHVVEELGSAVLRDNLRLIPIDRDDLYEDPGYDTMDRMQFCARRFEIPRWEAEELATQLAPDGKPRWNPQAVQRAIVNGTPALSKYPDHWRQTIDRPEPRGMGTAYEPMIGFELYALTPYMHRDGKRRRRLTVLNGELVESRGMPLHVSRTIPFYEIVVNPINGRFRGIAPGYVARWQQSFYDALLICLSEAVVRTTNPPIAVRRYGRVNRDQVLAWKGIIPLENMDDIREVQYKPEIGPAFQMLQSMKMSMREGSGATGAVQGLGFGTKRMSGTEAAFLGQQVMDRPEMLAAMFDREYLPNLGQGMFEIAQQMIRSSDDLVKRVGMSVAQGSPLLDDIQGEFEIRFVGSRRMKTKQDKLRAIEQLVQLAGAIPVAQAIIPWPELIREWVCSADLDKLESMIANPQAVQDNIYRTALMNMAGGRGGAPQANGNGAMPRTTPPGMLPAQTSGSGA